MDKRELDPEAVELNKKNREYKRNKKRTEFKTYSETGRLSSTPDILYDQFGNKLMVSNRMMVFLNEKKLRQLQNTKTPDYNIMIPDDENELFIPIGGIWRQRSSSSGMEYLKMVFLPYATVIVSHDQKPEAVDMLLQGLDKIPPSL